MSGKTSWNQVRTVLSAGDFSRRRKYLPAASIATVWRKASMARRHVFVTTVSLLADGEDRASRRPDNVLRRRTEEEAIEGTASVDTQDDQVAVCVRGHTKN